MVEIVKIVEAVQIVFNYPQVSRTPTSFPPTCCLLSPLARRNPELVEWGKAAARQAQWPALPGL